LLLPLPLWASLPKFCRTPVEPIPYPIPNRSIGFFDITT
jgi:hypothetical protein